jgi:hypothetical protein
MSILGPRVTYKMPLIRHVQQKSGPRKQLKSQSQQSLKDYYVLGSKVSEILNIFYISDNCVFFC